MQTTGSQDGRHRELTSWKEIAAHFQSNVRTVQHWEKERGLPVHRMPGKRGRVWASIAEVEKWKNSGAETALPETTQPALQLHPRLVGAAVLVLLAPIGVFAVYYILNRPGPPSMYRIERNTITVSDEHGKELWRRTMEKVESEAYQRPGRESMVWFGDLDDDGRIETLFDQRVKDQAASGILWCFSDKGTVKWRFVVGRAVSTSKQTFTPRFTVGNFVVKPMGRNRPDSVVVVGFHSPYYPTQVVLLSSKGDLVREYWHSGYIGYRGNLQIADLGDDGVNEIYLAGVNNGSRAATLVVLDPDTFGGASFEEETEYQLLGFTPGRETARILFPKSCISRAFYDYNSAESLHVSPDGLAVQVDEHLELGASLFYHISGDLKLRWIDVSDSFKAEHKQLRSRGLLDHVLSDGEVAQFRDIRVFTSAQAAARSARGFQEDKQTLSNARRQDNPHPNQDAVK